MSIKRPGKVQTTTYLSPENDSRNIVYGQALPTSEEAAGIFPSEYKGALEEPRREDWEEASPLQTQSQNTKTQEGAGTAENFPSGSYPPNPTPMQGAGDRRDRPIATPKVQPDQNPWSAQITSPEAVHDRNDSIYQTGQQPSQATPQRPEGWEDLSIPTQELMRRKPGWVSDRSVQHPKVYPYNGESDAKRNYQDNVAAYPSLKDKALAKRLIDELQQSD
jgi:hypothetical protein